MLDICLNHLRKQSVLSRVTFCWRRLVLSHRPWWWFSSAASEAELHQGAKSWTLPKSEPGKCSSLCSAARGEGSMEGATLRRVRSGRTTEKEKGLGSKCWCEWGGIMSIPMSQARTRTARNTEFFVVVTKVITCNCWVNSRMSDQRIEKKK